MESDDADAAYIAFCILEYVERILIPKQTDLKLERKLYFHLLHLHTKFITLIREKIENLVSQARLENTNASKVINLGMRPLQRPEIKNLYGNEVIGRSQRATIPESLRELISGEVFNYIERYFRIPEVEAETKIGQLIESFTHRRFTAIEDITKSLAAQIDEETGIGEVNIADGNAVKTTPGEVRRDYHTESFKMIEDLNTCLSRHKGNWSKLCWLHYLGTGLARILILLSSFTTLISVNKP